MTVRVVRSNMMYVPSHKVTEAHLEAYERIVFDENSCSRCVVKKEGEQGTYRCEGCPSFVGKVSLHKTIEKGGKEFVGFPSGNQKKFTRLFPDISLKDMRCTKPMRKKLTFTGKLKPYQEKCIKQFLSRGSGILEAPPRSGKTVMMVYLICEYGYRALILAHQDDLLDQFLTTLHNFTDIEDVEKYNSIRIAGKTKTPEDFDQYDICLCTYQSFIREGSGEAKILKHVNKQFGYIAVDECHRVAAECFSKVVNALDSKVRFGVTGTVERKDGMQFITTDILGPVVARASANILKPTVRITTTLVKFPSRETWVGFINTLSNHKARNKLLAKIALKAIKAGHSVVIPLARVQHIKDLTELINAGCGDTPLAAEFHSKVDKNKVLEDARSGKVKCVVAIRQMVQEGIDVPCWSYMVECIPISNPPKFFQESMRICTPMEGKTKAYIHFVVDLCSPQSQGCFRTTLFKSVFPLKFKMAESIKNKCLEAAKGKAVTKKKESKVFRQF